MSCLTIEDIHKIRAEHAVRTQSMSFAEYKASLHQEVKPLLDMLTSMKPKQKWAVQYPTNVEVSTFVAAEPQEIYKRK